tara:strand:- start:231 stop:833 length:603 start_codon:yes stop_codon:yes gene_type:complete
MAAAFGFSIGGSKLLAGDDGPPRCGVKDELANGIFRRKSKWGKNSLSYHMYARDTGELSKEEWDKEFRLAFDAWSEITPLVFQETDSYSGADIIVSVGRRRRESFGRSGGVLAWAGMPSGKNYDGQLLTKFDMAENWVLPGNSGIVLRSVACHEIGHLLGLDHSNDEKALMYPYINNALKPREDDITKIQKLYGSGKEEK